MAVTALEGGLFRAGGGMPQPIPGLLIEISTQHAVTAECLDQPGPVGMLLPGGRLEDQQCQLGMVSEGGIDALDQRFRRRIALQTGGCVLQRDDVGTWRGVQSDAHAGTPWWRAVAVVAARGLSSGR